MFASFSFHLLQVFDLFQPHLVCHLFKPSVLLGAFSYFLLGHLFITHLKILMHFCSWSFLLLFSSVCSHFAMNCFVSVYCRLVIMVIVYFCFVLLVAASVPSAPVRCCSAEPFLRGCLLGLRLSLPSWLSCCVYTKKLTEKAFIEKVYSVYIWTCKLWAMLQGYWMGACHFIHGTFRYIIHWVQFSFL